MRNFIPGIAISLFFLFALTGCEQEPKTLLTDGVWDFENMTTDSGYQDVKTLVAQFKAAFTDATLEFQSDETYLIESPILEPIAGTWSLAGDDQLILQQEGLGASTANIETLSKKELKYIETYADQNMNPYSVTTTWIRD
jgi:hypothetical protein